MTAKQLVTELAPLVLADRYDFALTRMMEEHLPQLPVTDGDAYLGLVTERELQSLEDPAQPLGNSGIIQRDVCIGEYLHLFDVVRMFSVRNLNILPVVDESNRYLGVIRPADALRSFAATTGADIPASIIVLEIENKNYNLSEILRVVESNDSKILGLFTMPRSGEETIEVTLRVSRKEIGPLLQAFFRLNYHVRASWSPEDSFHEVLKDRFDALMNYLNI